jgi:hypothetical protein
MREDVRQQQDEDPLLLPQRHRYNGISNFEFAFFIFCLQRFLV